MRFACDVGGTFTDLIMEEGPAVRLYKASTTPDDPVRGLFDALALAAADRGEAVGALLGRTDMFIHGTTRAINAILTGDTARTAFLTTAGHPDILVIREGGRMEVFNFTVPYPEPYVPRALTFEVPERIDATGRVVQALDHGAVLAVIERLKAAKIEAVAICLLWSIVNPAHEEAVGALLAENLPGVPVTLSHRLNPTLREYRRASSACIDASLKPLMGRYLRDVRDRLRAAGLKGPRADGQFPGRRDGCRGHGRGADPFDQFRPQHGAGRRPPLRPPRRRRRHRHRRRHRRHQL
jgi:N-methylhydantoinase A